MWSTRLFKCRFILSSQTCKQITLAPEMPEQTVNKYIGFLGAGQMAQALARGFLSSGALKGSQVTLTGRSGDNGFITANYEQMSRLKDDFGVEYLRTNNVMAQKSDVIFACVKPDVILPALKDIYDCLEDKLIVSVAAGITMAQIGKVIPASARLIRVMPNTPCLVQSGTAVYAVGPNVTDEDIECVKALCSGPFTVFEPVPESIINAASGISGCGPAYIFLVAEALADGGVRMGVPRPLATKLAISTILGAAQMLERTGENPAQLKNNVCSPGGATIAAVHALEQGGVRAAFMNAVQAAALRSKELAD